MFPGVEDFLCGPGAAHPLRTVERFRLDGEGYLVGGAGPLAWATWRRGTARAEWSFRSGRERPGDGMVEAVHGTAGGLAGLVEWKFRSGGSGRGWQASAEWRFHSGGRPGAGLLSGAGRFKTPDVSSCFWRGRWLRGRTQPRPRR